MLKENGPLMFINTVSTNVREGPHQKIFDSRTQNMKTANPKLNLNFIEERKLNNIIEMYEKDRPVLCNIICGDNEYVGIPFKKSDGKLFIKINEESVEEIIMTDITDVVIIRF